MFVRFRETSTYLRLSLIETCRRDGKVRHEHVASLGSVPLPLTVRDRIAFWTRLHDRLGKLGNRIDAAMQGKILGAIHARVPMVTADEQRALQVENAKADARHWSAMRALHAEQVAGHKGIIAKAERTIRAGEAAAEQADAHVQAAEDRIKRIERGEAVPDRRPLTREQFEAQLLAAGFTKADLRHMATLAELGEETIPIIRDAALEASRRAERSTARALLRNKRGA